MKRLFNKKTGTEKDIIILLSFSLYAFSIVAQQILVHLIGNPFVFCIRLCASILAVMYLLKHPKKKQDSKSSKQFLPLLSSILLPFFWNNAYVADGKWFDFASYILAIIYAIVVCFSDIAYETRKKFYKLFIYFGIITSVFSWLEYISIDTYSSIVTKLFSEKTSTSMIGQFILRKNLYGLTSHYSRNAFYIVIATIFSIYTYDDNPKKRYGLLVLFAITLLAIGKRGHLLFLIIALVLAYIIVKKVRIKTVVKLIASVALIIGALVATASLVPQIGHTINRAIEKSESSDDISTGRFDMYEDAHRMYEENNYQPIGWSRYASNTGYFHPALHNDYLQLYYETGIIGELLVVVPNLIILYYSAKRARRDDTTAKIALIYNLFFMTYSLTGLPHYDQETYFIYFIVNSFLFAKGEQNEKE